MLYKLLLLPPGYSLPTWYSLWPTFYIIDYTFYYHFIILPIRRRGAQTDPSAGAATNTPPTQHIRGRNETKRNEAKRNETKRR